jgi:probable HAF family extracellular repeat protein
LFTKRRVVLLGLALAVLSLGVASLMAAPPGGGGGGGPAPPNYQVIVLGTLGGDMSAVTGMNNLGHVVGVSKTADGVEHGFVWSLNGGMIDLNNLVPAGTEFTICHASDINDIGQIVGRMVFDDGVVHLEHAFRLTLVGPAGAPVLEDFSAPDAVYEEGSAINNRGDVLVGNVLYTDDVGPIAAPWNWPPSFHVNDNRQFAGSYNFPTGLHAARYSQSAGLQDLGFLKRAAGYEYSASAGINASGQVTGSSITGYSQYSYVYNAFRYTNGIGMVSLGTLGGKQSHGHDINSQGDVVGMAMLKSGIMRPFIYTDTHKMKDLSTLVANPPSGFATTFVPRSISDIDMIIGWWGIGTDNERGCILIPVSN